MPPSSRNSSSIKQSKNKKKNNKKKSKRRSGTMVRGHGGYITDALKSAAGAGLRGAGRGIGNMLGIGDFGEKAGGFLSKIFGFGQYNVKKNSLLGDQNLGFGIGMLEFCHKEYIQDVFSSTGFALTQFNINPGLSNLFPLLSQLANCFEQYQFLGLLFIYKSTSADALNSTNTALGTVVIATNYNASDAAFTSKQQMEGYEFNSQSAPSMSHVHAIECDPKQTTLERMYVRSQALSTNQDVKFYDLGLLQLATQGMQAVSTIGEFQTVYHIRLFKPKLPDPGVGDLVAFHATNTITPPASASNVLGNANITLTGSSQFVLNSSKQLVMPAGNFLLLAIATGSSASFSTGFVFANVGCTNVNQLAGNTTDLVASTTNSSAGLLAFTFSCVSGGSSSVTVSYPTYTTGSSYTFDLFIFQIPGPTYFLPNPKELMLQLANRLDRIEQRYGNPTGKIAEFDEKSVIPSTIDILRPSKWF
jgi:hypothetical protein